MENQATIEITRANWTALIELLEKIPADNSDEHRIVHELIGHFKAANDNEDSSTPTDKPTIKKRMDGAKSRMEFQTGEAFYYWAGYLCALVEVREGDIDISRPEPQSV